MQISAAQLASLLDGTVEGNPETTVSAPSRIEEGKPGTITFLAHPKYEDFAYTTQASVMLVSKEWKPRSEVTPTLVRVDDVYASVQSLLKQFDQVERADGEIHETAIIHPDAEVSSGASIQAYSIIAKGAKVGAGTIIHSHCHIGEDVVIGKECMLYEGVKLARKTVIGNFCKLHQGVVIGSEGFGFAQNDAGEFVKIPQIGNVILEDHVDVGVNSIVDRATIGSTLLRRGVKIDNLVQVGHNVEIGENSAMAAQVGLAGSTRIGKNCMIGGQVGFAGHLTVADGAMIGAQSGVNNDVKETDSRLIGSPAIDYGTFWRLFATYKNLPDMARTIRRLEKELNQLKSEA